jgi:hypothetical protein
MADMERKTRGVVLTIFAICLGLMAVSNFLKPLKLGSYAGFVFFGMKLSGLANTIVGPIFGVILAALAYGIFTMRRFALPLLGLCRIRDTEYFAVHTAHVRNL